MTWPEAWAEGEDAQQEEGMAWEVSSEGSFAEATKVSQGGKATAVMHLPSQGTHSRQQWHHPQKTTVLPPHFQPLDPTLGGSEIKE